MNNQRATQSAPARAQDSRPAACAGWFESTWDLIRGLDVRELHTSEALGMWRAVQPMPIAA